jgi:hypothetical protein
MKTFRIDEIARETARTFDGLRDPMDALGRLLIRLDRQKQRISSAHLKLVAEEGGTHGKLPDHFRLTGT